MTMFARKAAVSVVARLRIVFAEEARVVDIWEGQRGELVTALSHALISSSCEQARAIAPQYFTSLFLESSFTWPGLPLTARLADRSSIGDSGSCYLSQPL